MCGYIYLNVYVSMCCVCKRVRVRGPVFDGSPHSLFPTGSTPISIAWFASPYLWRFASFIWRSTSPVSRRFRLLPMYFQRLSNIVCGLLKFYIIWCNFMSLSANWSSPSLSQKNESSDQWSCVMCRVLCACIVYNGSRVINVTCRVARFMSGVSNPNNYHSILNTIYVMLNIPVAPDPCQTLQQFIAIYRI